MGKYMIFDLETEVHSPYKRRANPFCKDNWVVMRGWKLQGDTRGYAKYYPQHDRTSYLEIPEDVTLLVGLNIKFDLLYEMAQGNKSLRRFFKRGGKVWCCQYAEYLLYGHEKDVQMASMDGIIEKYGGRKKIDEVKLLWEAGVKTSEISEQLLADYLLGTHAEMRNSGDIGNTEKIFLGQIRKAALQKQMLMIEDRMDGLLCTTEMEFNGLKIDVLEGAKRLRALTQDLQTQSNTLQEFLPKDLPWEFNWNSRHQVSALIYGGAVKYQVRDTYLDETTNELARLKAEERWPLFNAKAVDYRRCLYDEVKLLWYIQGSARRVYQDTWKSGKKEGEGKTRAIPVEGELKVKWQDRIYDLDGYTIPKDEWKGAETDARDNPIYGTGSEIIEELVARTNIPFLSAYNRKNTLDKEIGTYYVTTNDEGERKGMLTCVQSEDHMLHHKLNHSSTVTSRLSSNDPNLQNIPKADFNKEGIAKSEVKKMFISRFGVNGRMGEIDYSQLEVVVQGVLSGDPGLCRDLVNKVDFHCMRVAAKFKISYEAAVDWCKNEKHPDYAAGKIERTKCKIFSFQRAYGAGAAKIALTTGMPIKEVEELIENEDLLYPGVVAFNDNVKNAVNLSAEPFSAFCDVRQTWRQFRKGYYVAPTGTRYAFRTFDAPSYLQKRGVDQTFSPTQLKNYPVQGTGGEFVQAMLGRLFRHFASNDNYGGKAFLCNTVHDCVWVDMHESVVDQVISDMIRIMESIPEYYNSRYGMNITVPFPVEAEIGMNMLDLHHWKAAA